ncbi:MAG: hypothetical protein ACXWT1_09840 [Methylobacter sp.]
MRNISYSSVALHGNEGTSSVGRAVRAKGFGDYSIIGKGARHALQAALLRSFLVGKFSFLPVFLWSFLSWG